MDNEILWSMLFILWIVLIGLTIFFWFSDNIPIGPGSESFTHTRIREGITNKEDNTPIPRKNLEIINWHMAGSYNSCFSNNHDKASIESLEKVLKDGIRCLDFEIFLEKEKNTNTNLMQKVAIVGSSLNNIGKLEAEKLCRNKDKKIKKKTTFPNKTIRMEKIFETIYKKGFFDTTHKNYPIFINLRIKTPDPDGYIKLKEDLEKSELFKNNKILDTDFYGKAQSKIKIPDKELIYQELVDNKFKQKVIIMVEDYCRNYENTPFYNYIHFIAGKNLTSNKAFESEAKQIPIIEQKKTFSIVVPDDKIKNDPSQKYMTQPALWNCKENGINIMYWNYLCTDCTNNNGITNLENGGYDEVKKKFPDESFKGFFSGSGSLPKWFTPKAPELHWKLEDTLSKDIAEPDKCYTDLACIKRINIEGQATYKNLKTDKECRKEAINNQGWICEDLGFDNKGDPKYKMIALYDENKKNIFKKK